MDKLQQAFEHEFNTQLKRLMNEALSTVNVPSLIENTVKERLSSGQFQQYINDTVKQHVNGVSINDQAISRLEQKGQEAIQQHIPRVVQIIQDRIDLVLSDTVDQKLQNFSPPKTSIDTDQIDVSKLKITTANIVDFDEHIQSWNSNANVSDEVKDTVIDTLEQGSFQQYINDTIKQYVNNISITDTAISRLEEKGQLVITQQMPKVIQTIVDRIDKVMGEVVDQKLRDLAFPEQSIDPRLIDIDKLKISVKNITDFGNTAGIEDIADKVQLTVMNDSVVVESKIITDAVNANTVFADTLIARDIATDQPWVSNLKKDFLKSVPKPKAPKDWSFKIAEMDARIDVNAKKSGELAQLEVSGESLLSDVLYTTPGNKRVGINTLEPSDALTVWDQEVEFVVGKHATQEGYIGTRRRQNLNIGANNKVGIQIDGNGMVKLDKLTLQGRIISSEHRIPNHASKTGDIVLNTRPVVGSHIGWVCLDGIKWAGFGRID
tara:strand:- start:630 stop:2105 length:1476 start_codon:yes stop_codon:yes gene_type:complete